MHGLKPLLFLLSVGFFLYSKSRSVPDGAALLSEQAHTAGALLEENADLRQRIAQLEHRAQECEVGSCLQESCNHCGVSYGIFLGRWAVPAGVALPLLAPTDALERNAEQAGSRCAM